MLIENLGRLCEKHDSRAFNIDELKRGIDNDKQILKEIHDTVGEIDQDTPMR